MKILLAASCPSNRNLGVPGVMHCLGDEFTKADHEVRYLFRDEPGRIGEMLFGLRLSSSPLARWADVVDVHAVDAWPLCGKRHGPVVVARSHGLELAVHRRLLAAAARGDAAPSRIYWLYRGSVRLWLERMAARHADAMLVLNDSDRKICLGELGGTPSRIQMVPNGYPRVFLDHPTNPGRGIAFVGSWIHRKGNDLAVAALSDLVRSGFEDRILLLGGGVPAETILADFPEDVRPRLDVRPKFTRPELPALLEGCGVLLFPSRSEGYPLALVEAMACGVAPVASAIPGVVELVTDRINGRLVPSEDPAALSKALAETVADLYVLGRLRVAARDSVRATSWESIAADQLSLYGGLLEARRARR